MTDNQTGRRYQEIADIIQNHIQHQHYKAGERLPAERQLASELSVGRSVLREALIMLEIKGLIEVRPGSGIYVVDSVHQEINVQSFQLSEVGPFEMLQARQLIESHIAEMAAWQITKADIDMMQKTLDDERSDIENQIISDDNDKRFHHLIAKSTQNSVLVDIVDSMWLQRESSAMWRQLHMRIADNSYRGLWVDEHQAILNALKQRSPSRAKQAMWTHLEHVRDILFTLSDLESPDFDGYLFPIHPPTHQCN